MTTSQLLSAQLRNCPALPAQWHRLALRVAKADVADPTLLATLAARLDLPADVRTEIAAMRQAAVRERFLRRADLTPAEITALIATETRASALANLVAWNPTSEQVVAGASATFLAKPTKALAVALLGAQETLICGPVAAAVCLLYAGDAHWDLGETARQTLERWAKKLTADQAGALIAATDGAPKHLGYWATVLPYVEGLSDADRATLLEARIAVDENAVTGRSGSSGAVGRSLDYCAAHVARLVGDLDDTHPLRVQVQALADDTSLSPVFTRYLAEYLQGPWRRPGEPSFPKAVPDKQAGHGPAAVLALLEPGGRSRLAETTTDPELLRALVDCDELDVTTALLTNLAVTDTTVLLVLLERVDAQHGDRSVEEIAALAHRCTDPQVLAAALRVDAAATLAWAAVADFAPGVVRAALIEAAQHALTQDDRVGWVRSRRPEPARANAQAIMLAAHLPAELFDVIPVPLLAYWSSFHPRPVVREGTEPPFCHALWSRVAAVQGEVAEGGDQAWETFHAMWPTFTGTLGELAAAVLGVLG